MTLLQELESAVQAAVEHTGPAVVGLGRGWGVGSGVVVAPGRVLTNAHNLRQSETSVTFSDGRRASGRVLGSDPDLDVAIIEVETADVRPVRWPSSVESSSPASSAEGGPGDGAQARGGTGPVIGRAVLALGNPGGRGLRVTPGFVSSTARSFRGPRGRRISGAIEHTAPLPRGSSGGPLIEIDGDLIGINSVRVDGGLILAVPADEALRQRVEALGRGEEPERLRLGVALAPPRVARRLRRAVGLPERDGVLIRGVQEGSAAARAGLQRGDLIVAAAGAGIDRVDILYEALDAARAERTLELEILRGNDQRTVTVTF